MKMFIQPSQVFLCRDFVDFRKSINGLSQIVEEDLGLSSMSGALFVFCNKAKDKLKILYWDNTGFALWYKRLEKERFKWPAKFDADLDSEVELTEQQLNWLLEGYSVIGHQALDFQSKIT
jgi:transposase